MKVSHSVLSCLTQSVNSEDTIGDLKFHSILATPACTEQVENLVVLDHEGVSEASESKASHKDRKTHPDSLHHEDTVHYCNTSRTHRIWNKLNTRQCLHWKRPAVHNDQDSDPQSTCLYRSSDTFYQSGHREGTVVDSNDQIKSEKDSVGNSQSFSDEQNGLQEYAEERPGADCKINPTTQEKEDYSKVSGIYSDVVLVLEKDSRHVFMLKGKQHGFPSKEIYNKSTATDIKVEHSQDYVDAV